MKEQVLDFKKVTLTTVLRFVTCIPIHVCIRLRIYFISDFFVGIFITMLMY